MSKVAGRMAIQAGAYCLEHPHGGLGMLLGGVPGVDPAKVVILGAGVVGTHATHIAVGMGADVWVIDRNPEAIEAHWKQFGRSTNTVFSTQDAVERHVLDADLVIGGVLIPGAEAPKLVTAEMVKAMKPGAVIVDVAIDQGGCCETSKPTTHAEPTYIVDDVVHYCVANMPGGVPRTSTYALNNVTLPHVLALAGNIDEAVAGAAEFIALPETVGLIEPVNERIPAATYAESDDIGLAAFCGKACEHGVMLLVGSQLIREEDRIFNRCFLLDTDGEIRARYDKLHMFDIELQNGEAYRESDAIAPGDKAVIVETPFGRLGLSICYDLRFGALYRALAHAGAEMITIPAAFRDRRLYHRSQPVRSSLRQALLLRPFADCRSVG
jgi:hypothetical protein